MMADHHTLAMVGPVAGRHAAAMAGTCVSTLVRVDLLPAWAALTVGWVADTAREGVPVAALARWRGPPRLGRVVLAARCVSRT